MIYFYNIGFKDLQMSKIGLYTEYERTSILVFLVILLIFIGFLGLLKLSLRKAINLLRGEAAWPVKSFSKNAGVLQVDLRSVAFASISFAKTVSVIANAYQAVTNAAGCLAAIARPIFYKFGSKKTVTETSRSRYVRNPELSCGTKSTLRNFSGTIKCTVAVTHINITRNSPEIITPRSEPIAWAND